MKLVKFLVVTMMLISMVTLAGCGGDKFVGKWYAMNDSDMAKSSYVELDIEKNGDGYLIKESYFQYESKVVVTNKKEYEESKRFSSPFMTGRDYGVAMKKRIAPIWEVTAQWTKRSGRSIPCSVKDNKLEAGRIGDLVYVEKSGTLISTDGEKIEYKREKDFKPKDVQMQLRKKIEDNIEDNKKLKDKVTDKSSIPIINKLEIIDELKEVK